MTSDTDKNKSRAKTKKQRSKPYIPNLAEFSFEPTDDWSHEKAKKLYDKREASLNGFDLDTIQFAECIEGMKNLPKAAIDLVVADPPFGIEFDGMSSVYNRDESLVIPGYQEANGSYEEFTKDWIAQLPRIMKRSAPKAKLPVSPMKTCAG